MPQRFRVPTGGWQNRIVGSGVKPASQFLAHPRNARIHPSTQQRALVAVLAQVGWIQNVIENIQTGHLLDGHIRVLAALDEGDDTPVPYIKVDLPEAMESLVLAALDPLSAMAGKDAEKYDALLADVTRETGLDLLSLLEATPERKPKVRGLAHDVRACTCCEDRCSEGCGCFREN